MFRTQYKQLIIACIIGGIIGIFCSLFFNNLLWIPLLIMVAGLVSFFCKPAATIPPKEETKFSNQ
ncbi:MAG: hypothetical protein ACFFAL_06460 [Promethearchaeota archaeon]